MHFNLSFSTEIADKNSSQELCCYQQGDYKESPIAILWMYKAFHNDTWEQAP